MWSDWQQASFLSTPEGGFLIVPDTLWVGRYDYPHPCPSRVPRGETPVMGDPDTVATVYGADWRRDRISGTLCGFRVLNLATGERACDTLFGCIRDAQIWVEEQQDA